MKLLSEYSKIKEKVMIATQIKGESDCPPEVSKAITSIKEKMNQCKMGELHPPFLPKSVTRYRHEYFLPVKR